MSGRFPDTATRGKGKPTIEFVDWLSSVADEMGARRDDLDDPVWRVDLRRAKQAIDHAVRDMRACMPYRDDTDSGEQAGVTPAGKPSEAFVRRLADFASNLDFDKVALGHPYMGMARVAVIVLHNLAERLSVECGYHIYSDDGDADPGGAPMMHVDLIDTGETS